MTDKISNEARELAIRVMRLAPGSMGDRDRSQLLCQHALNAARNQALEDAAKHINVHWSRPGAEFATAIRTLVQP